MGSLFYRNLQNVLGIDNLYQEAKNKYDVLYRELNIEKDSKKTTAIAVMLIIIFIFNIINFVNGANGCQWGRSILAILILMLIGDNSDGEFWQS